MNFGIMLKLLHTAVDDLYNSYKNMHLRFFINNKFGFYGLIEKYLQNFEHTNNREGDLF